MVRIGSESDINYGVGAIIVCTIATSSGVAVAYLRDHIINRQAIGGFIGFGLLAAVFAYGNFLLFFVRHHLSTKYLDPTLPLYHQAQTRTYLPLVLCLSGYLMFERTDRQAH